MSSGSPDNPYSVAAPLTQVSLSSNSKRLLVVALFETCIAIVLLLLAAGMLFLTAAFVIWAIQQKDMQLFGMFMAASVRAAVAIMLAVPGLLLLSAARWTRTAAADSQDSTIKRMYNAHWLLMFSLVAIGLLSFGAIVAFFIAFSFSNM